MKSNFNQPSQASHAGMHKVTTLFAHMRTRFSSVGTLAALLLILGSIAIGYCVSSFTPFGVTLGLLVALPEGQKRSGKSGTVVWQRNNRMRVNAFPRLVQNAYTTAIRATLGSFSSAWNSLTQANQSSWLNAAGFTATNRLGETIILKGKTLYVTLNTNLDTIGVADISTAPGVTAVPSPLLSLDPVADVSATSITFPVSNSDAGRGVSIQCTAKVSGGTNSPGKNRYRTIYSISDSTAIVAVDINTAYAARFGALAAGDIFFIRATYINNVTGQQSGVSQAFKVVTVA